MNPTREDTGEAAIALPEPQAAASQKLFFARVGMLLLLAGLLYLVWRIVAPLWQPVIWAILLGALLAPATARLAVRLGNRPRLASSLVTVAVVLLLLLPILALGGAVAAQAAQLVQLIDTSSVRASNLDLADFPVLAGPLTWLETTAGLSLAQIEGWIVMGAKRLLEFVAASGGAVFLGALGTIMKFLLMLFVLFFMLRDGPQIAQTLVRMLPIETHLRGKLWRHLIDVTRAVFMGIGLTALVQGTLLGIGFAIAGLPSPLLFGVLGALFALVVFLLTAVSAPMLVDRDDVSVLEAMQTSVAACFYNWRPMLVWAALIAICIGAGFITMYVALAIGFPVIGHATWHAYRDLVKQ